MSGITNDTLNITNKKDNLYLGEQLVLDIPTEGIVTAINCSDTNVIQGNKETRTIKSVGMGNSTIEVILNTGTEFQRARWEIVVDKTKPASDTGNPVNLKLVNSQTNRTVQLQTTNNEAVDDVFINLPKDSGTLLTEEALYTDTSVIKNPVITSPVSGVEDFTGTVYASEFVGLLGNKEKHLYTDWEVYTTSSLEHLIESKRITYPEDELTHTVFSLFAIKGFVRCRYGTENFESRWSEAIEINFGSTPPMPVSEYWPHNLMEQGDDNNEGLVAKCGIVGRINTTDCTTYEYRGSFNTIAKYAQGSNNIAELPLNATVEYNGKLYKVIAPAGTTAASILATTPDRDTEYFKVDEDYYNHRMITTTDVYKRLRLQPGVRDNNMDLATTSPDGNTRHTLGSAPVSDEDWLICINRGKMFLISNHTTRNIAWNDLMAIEHHDGGASITANGVEYRSRFMKIEEFRNCFLRVANTNLNRGRPGTPLSHNDSILGDYLYMHDSMSRNGTCGVMRLDSYSSYNNRTATTDKDYINVNNSQPNIIVGERQELEILRNSGSDSDPIKIISSNPELVKIEENNGIYTLVGVKASTLPVVINVWYRYYGKENDDYTLFYNWEITCIAEETEESIRLRAQRNITSYVDQPCIRVTKDNDIKNRAAGYFRSLLEVRKPGDEGYRRIRLDVPKADNEKFVYDKYTDTGFFGRVSADKVIKGENLITRIDMNFGTNHVRVNCDWLKFYWHGKIIFTPINCIRYNLSWIQLRDAQLLYGYNVNTGKERTITIGNVPFRLSMLSGLRTRPYDITGHPYGRDIRTFYSKLDRCRYSQISELMFRVCGNMYVDGGAESIKWNVLKAWYSGDGGLQKGDNFTTEIHTDELIIDYTKGYGNYTLIKDVDNTNGLYGWGWLSPSLLHRSGYTPSTPGTGGYRPTLSVSCLQPIKFKK